jgi:hypothetical protein
MVGHVVFILPPSSPNDQMVAERVAELLRNAYYEGCRTTQAEIRKALEG